MKALLYKEFKLAMHPMCYVFIFAFPLLILVPAYFYPIGVGFIYVLTCYPVLFLGANKGQQSNDLLYSTLLPVRKRDIVLARILTVVIMHFVFIAVMSALMPISRLITQSYVNYYNSLTPEEIAEKKLSLALIGLGLDSYVLLLAIALFGFAIADLIFFPIYYKNGKSIVLSTLLTIFSFVIYICVMTTVLPVTPELDWINHMRTLLKLKA